MNKPFEKKIYYALTIDPVHIGTGGYRLGRVDNTITREPGTNLPKIPGSSIAGVTRAYTAMALQNGKFIEIPDHFQIDYEVYRMCKYLRPAYQIRTEETSSGIKAFVKTDREKKPFYEGDNPEEEKFYSCAGKGANDGEGHCGEFDCPVCIAFGFSKGKTGSSFQGLAQFFDARILFFPIHSMIGPVWITCPSILNEFGISCEIDEKRFKAINREYNQGLNFGWLMLEQDTPNKTDIDLSKLSRNKKICEVFNKFIDSAFLISDRLFSRIVNDNLEVRTSVSINPVTGAAEEGALYTYEAIPRSTVMWFDVIFNNPEHFKVVKADNTKSIKLSKPEDYKSPLGNLVQDQQIDYMAAYVEKGLMYLEDLGIGGMGTRGMGRLRILNIGGEDVQKP